MPQPPTVTLCISLASPHSVRTAPRCVVGHWSLDPFLLCYVMLWGGDAEGVVGGVDSRKRRGFVRSKTGFPCAPPIRCVDATQLQACSPAASSSPGSAAPVAAALPALPQQHAAEEPSALELRNSYASRARGRRVTEPHPTASHRAYPPNLSSPSGTSLPPFAGCGGREPENDRTNSSPDVTGCFWQV